MRRRNWNQRRRRRNSDGREGDCRRVQQECGVRASSVHRDRQVGGTVVPSNAMPSPREADVSRKRSQPATAPERTLMDCFVPPSKGGKKKHQCPQSRFSVGRVYFLFTYSVQNDNGTKSILNVMLCVKRAFMLLLFDG